MIFTLNLRVARVAELPGGSSSSPMAPTLVPSYILFELLGVGVDEEAPYGAVGDLSPHPRGCIWMDASLGGWMYSDYWNTNLIIVFFGVDGVTSVT